MDAVSITIDVETDHGGRTHCQPKHCRGIEEGIPLILDLLNNNNLKATFFVSGMLVKQYKGLIKEIYQEGHEIASHGLGHNINYRRLTQRKFHAQLIYSRQILEQAIGNAIAGFRSPQFRIHKHHFSMLGVAGYTYDSSLVTGVMPGRYNNLGIPTDPYFVDHIFEIPVSTFPFIRLPLSLLSIHAIGLAAFKKIMPFLKFKKLVLIYLHPFDILPNRAGYRGGLVAKFWNGPKATGALQTLGTLLSLLTREKKQFMRLGDYCSSQGKATLR